ncbi:MAG: nucleotidyltransferase domain-containing protein [Deltaproteobacteria bacterium]|jgi:hypothetical protein|nr:nucleotidyltransferase domain-containing protein [Deltaproteobacteria bacterium]
MAYTVEDIKRIVAPIAERHGVGRVWLFGSYARGEARPDSDKDLLIDKGKIRDYFQISDLCICSRVGPGGRGKCPHPLFMKVNGITKVIVAQSEYLRPVY